MPSLLPLTACMRFGRLAGSRLSLCLVSASTGGMRRGGEQDEEKKNKGGKRRENDEIGNQSRRSCTVCLLPEGSHNKGLRQRTFAIVVGEGRGVHTPERKEQTRQEARRRKSLFPLC